MEMFTQEFVSKVKDTIKKLIESGERATREKIVVELGFTKETSPAVSVLLEMGLLPGYCARKRAGIIPIEESGGSNKKETVYSDDYVSKVQTAVEELYKTKGKFSTKDVVAHLELGEKEANNIRELFRNEKIEGFEARRRAGIVPKDKGVKDIEALSQERKTLEQVQKEANALTKSGVNITNHRKDPGRLEKDEETGLPKWALK